MFCTDSAGEGLYCLFPSESGPTGFPCPIRNSNNDQISPPWCSLQAMGGTNHSPFAFFRAAP